VADSIWPIISIANIALIILIAVLVVWKMRKEKKSGFPLKDERTQKLNGKAAYYAMFICQYFILAYVWVIFIGKEFFGMPEIEAGYPMIATLLVSALSFLVLRAYFGRKGEP
jgi:Na+/H+ antiporter NhaD/arsenite permease-like protein